MEYDLTLYEIHIHFVSTGLPFITEETESNESTEDHQ